MTETDRIYDLNIQIVLSSSESVSTITNDSSFCNNFLSSDIRFSDSSETNLNIGIAATITDSIIQHEDRLLARERIKKKQNDGNTFKSSIAEAQKISAGFCFKHGEVRLGQTLVDGIVNRKRVQEELVIEKECKKKMLMKGH